MDFDAKPKKITLNTELKGPQMKIYDGDINQRLIDENLWW